MAEPSNDAVRLCRRYCKLLHRELAAAPQLRRRAVQDTRASLEEYLERNPAAGWDDLTAEFGTPRQAAEQILGSLDAEQIRREVRRFRWRRIAALTVILLALIYVIFYCGRIAVNKITQPGYVVIGPAVEIEGPIPTNTPAEKNPFFW